VLNWFRFERNRYSVRKVVTNILVILALNVLFLGSNPKVDNNAHFGGFVAGIFLALTFGDLLEKDRTLSNPYEKKVKLFGAVIWIASLPVMLLLLYIKK
jgi:membrane associated rhomboid family serine protease